MKRTDLLRKKSIALVLLLCLTLLLSGCGHELASYRPIEDVNNLEGRKIGVNLAWPADYVLSPRDGKDLILYRYDTTADMLMALFYHQIDAICGDISDCHILEYTNGDSIRRVEESVAMDGFVAYMSPSREALRDEFNEFIAYYHQTEEFADLYGRLMNFTGEVYIPGEYIHPNGSGEKLKIAFSADVFPYCYVEPDGSIRGFDIELFYAFADYSGYELEFIATSEEDVYYGVTIDRYDISIGCISQSYAIEAESMGVYPTDMYYEMPLYLVELVDGKRIEMDDSFYITY